jgi:hypothetical protein
MPTFSDDVEQNAELQMQYAFECRLQGLDPYYAGDSDYELDDEYGWDDEVEEDE